jgi:hypothetical protein
MKKFLLAAVLAAISGEAQAFTCLGNVLPDGLKVMNAFFLERPDGCEEAKILFVKIENKTPWCLAPKWTGRVEATQVVSIVSAGYEVVMQNGAPVEMEVEAAIPNLVYDPDGLPASCIPPYADAWTMAPTKGAYIQAVAYDGVVVAAQPRLVPLLNGASALFVGMGAGYAETSEVTKIWKARPTSVGNWHDQTLDSVVFRE